MWCFVLVEREGGGGGEEIGMRMRGMEIMIVATKQTKRNKQTNERTNKQKNKQNKQIKTKIKIKTSLAFITSPKPRVTH